MEDNGYYSCIDLLIKINRAHKKTIDYSVSTKIGLHRTQHIILMKLSKSNSLPSQKELAKHIGVSAAAISGALKKLEESELITRRIGSDCRFNEIEITEKGKSIVSITKKLFAEIDKGLFEGFTDDELISFMGYLDRINKNVNKMEVDI